MKQNHQLPYYKRRQTFKFGTEIGCGEIKSDRKTSGLPPDTSEVKISQKKNGTEELSKSIFKIYTNLLKQRFSIRNTLLVQKELSNLTKW